MAKLNAILRKYFPLKDSPKLDPQSLFRRVSVILVAVLFLGNQALAIRLADSLTRGHDHAGEIKLSGEFASDVATLVTPTSLPFYGPELGLDFSNVGAINASIAKMSKMAPMQGSNPIQLTTEEMKRYVEIGTEPYVTCEFCCGVTTLVREDGSPTCGCAHSIAMRGTAAYLIRNYPQMTNAEIAYELMRQKGLYFPVQMQERMASTLAGDLSQAKPDIKYLIMNLSEQEIADLQEKAKSEGFEPEKAPDMIGGC